MQKITNNTHDILDHLIALTGERDLASLERLLARSLSEFLDDDVAKEVVKIFHVRNLKDQIFTTLQTKRSIEGEDIPAAYKDALTYCFISGEDHQYIDPDNKEVALYPLHNSQHEVMAVIALHIQIDDPDTKKIIRQVIRVYQNYTSLIRDNEHDTLTGLLNRKTFEYRMQKMLTVMHKTKQRRDDQPNSAYFLAVFDIDHFKRINDEHGHLIGDEVLLTFSQLMKRSFREKDMLFRYGGEEFITVFECAQAQDIDVVLERFRKLVETHKFPTVNHITVSMGYTQVLTYDMTLQVVGRADQALYYAKENGRNQIQEYEKLLEKGILQEAKKENELELF